MAALIGAAPMAAQDAAEIVRRSVEVDQQTVELAARYTYQRRNVTRQLDGGGRAVKTTIETHDVVNLGGEPYSRLVEKNDKPLSGEDERKAREKFDKATSRITSETPAQREKRLEEARKHRERDRAFAREIPNAYSFRLLESERVDGHDCWVIEATPRPGYTPRDNRTRMLPKMRGKLWIDKRNHQWARVEAESIDTLSFGWVVARIGKGARFSIVNRYVNGEIWMPEQATLSADGRIGLLKRIRLDADIRFRNYRKFQTESRVVAAESIAQP